jgi:hypothetical protein
VECPLGASHVVVLNDVVLDFGREHVELLGSHVHVEFPDDEGDLLAAVVEVLVGGLLHVYVLLVIAKHELLFLFRHFRKVFLDEHRVGLVVAFGLAGVAGGGAGLVEALLDGDGGRVEVGVVGVVVGVVGVVGTLEDLDEAVAVDDGVPAVVAFGHDEVVVVEEGLGEFGFGEGVPLEEVVVAVHLVPLHLVRDPQLLVLRECLQQLQVVPHLLLLVLFAWSFEAFAAPVLEFPFGETEDLEEETEVVDLVLFDCVDALHHVDLFEGHDVADSVVKLLLDPVPEDELDAGTEEVVFVALLLLFHAEEAEVGGRAVGLVALVLLGLVLQFLLELFLELLHSSFREVL